MNFLKESQSLPWLDRLKWGLMLSLMRKVLCCALVKQGREWQVASRIWDQLPADSQPARNRGPQSYSSKELGSVRNQWVWKKTLSFRWDCVLMDTLMSAWWVHEQKTQLIHAQTPDPWKRQDNKFVLFSVAEFMAIYHAAIEN